MYKHTYIYVYIYIYIHPCIHTEKIDITNTHTHTHIYIYIYVHVYAVYVYTNMHALFYLYRCSFVSRFFKRLHGGSSPGVSWEFQDMTVISNPKQARTRGHHVLKLLQSYSSMSRLLGAVWIRDSFSVHVSD